MVADSITRRNVMVYGAGAGLLAALPWPIRASRALLAGKKQPVRTLWLYNTHTGETLKQTYWEKGRYCPSALQAINKLLRDHRSGTIFPMDRRVLDMVVALQCLLDYKKPLDIISGYRSPATNAMLIKKGREVAPDSYHTKGMAMDIHFRGTALSKAKCMAQSLKMGGVGYYPNDGFIHVDVRGSDKILHW